MLLPSGPFPVVRHGNHFIGRLGNRDMPFQHAANPLALGHIQILQRFLFCFPVGDTARKQRDFRMISAVHFRRDFIRVIQVHVKVDVFHSRVVPCVFQTNVLEYYIINLQGKEDFLFFLSTGNIAYQCTMPARSCPYGTGRKTVLYSHSPLATRWHWPPTSIVQLSSLLQA